MDSMGELLLQSKSEISFIKLVKLTLLHVRNIIRAIIHQIRRGNHNMRVALGWASHFPSEYIRFLKQTTIYVYEGGVAGIGLDSDMCGYDYLVNTTKPSSAALKRFSYAYKDIDDYTGWFGYGSKEINILHIKTATGNFYVYASNASVLFKTILACQNVLNRTEADKMWKNTMHMLTQTDSNHAQQQILHQYKKVTSHDWSGIIDLILNEMGRIPLHMHGTIKGTIVKIINDRLRVIIREVIDIREPIEDEIMKIQDYGDWTRGNELKAELNKKLAPLYREQDGLYSHFEKLDPEACSQVRNYEEELSHKLRMRNYLKSLERKPRQ